MGKFWMVRNLVLEFGIEVVGVILSSGSYTSMNILDWRGFYNKWELMF
jgi:hypothetical protein